MRQLGNQPAREEGSWNRLKKKKSRGVTTPAPAEQPILTAPQRNINTVAADNILDPSGLNNVWRLFIVLAVFLDPTGLESGG